MILWTCCKRYVWSTGYFFDEWWILFEPSLAFSGIYGLYCVPQGMLQLILATDMARHKEILDALQNNIKKFEWDSKSHMDSVIWRHNSYYPVTHCLFGFFFKIFSFKYMYHHLPVLFFFILGKALLAYPTLINELKVKYRSFFFLIYILFKNLNSFLLETVSIMLPCRMFCLLYTY